MIQMKKIFQTTIFKNWCVDENKIERKGNIGDKSNDKK